MQGVHVSYVECLRQTVGEQGTPLLFVEVKIAVRAGWRRDVSPWKCGVMSTVGDDSGICW